jgi:hypothetical protein
MTRLAAASFRLARRASDRARAANRWHKVRSSVDRIALQEGNHPMSIQGLRPLENVSYQAGVCNIGTAETRRRRMAGHAGALAAAVIYVALVAAGSAHALRLIVALPAAMSAVGYIQARLHFCANYGSRGVFNFGDLGSLDAVQDDAARAKDRRRSLEIGLGSAAIGIGVGIVAALLPIN